MMNNKRKKLPPCLGFEEEDTELEQTTDKCRSCNRLVNQGKPLCEEDCEPNSEKCLSHECRK